MSQDDLLHGLHQVRSQGNRPEVVRVLGALRLQYQDHTGGLPQGRDFLQAQAQVKQVPDHTTELVSTVLEESRADAVRSRGLPCLFFLS